MTFYETLTLLISLLAIFVSLVSLTRIRKIASQQLELEKKTADLAEKQLELIISKERESLFAQIDVELKKSDNDYKFVIVNKGGAEARDVNFSIDGKGYPLTATEYAEKIPILNLRPGKSVELSASKTMDCGSSYLIKVFWKNPDETQGKDEINVHW